MSRFVDLASDPFNDIIRTLGILELAKLWLCGDLRLQWRLSSGKAVQSIKIEYQEISKPFWPVVVRHFVGLETFWLESELVGSKSRKTTPYLSSLSCNLKSLRLDTPTSISDFNRLMKKNARTFPYLEDLALTSQQLSGKLNIKIPHTVTILQLGSYYDQVGSLPLSALPPGLISLTCGVVDLIISEDRPKFPVGLLKLDFSSPDPYKPLFSLLPSTLQNLTIHHYNRPRAILTDEDWGALSRLSLISLEMSLSSVLKPLEAQKLPRTLEVLKIRTSGAETEEECLSILPELPQNLKRINILPSSISASIAKLLPTMLEMDFVNPTHAEACQYLPLKTKGIRLEENSDLSLIESLPPFLESLIIHGLPKKIASMLPDTLQILRIQSSKAILSEKIFELLPPKLAALSISALIDEALNFNRCLELLPRSITKIVLRTTENDEFDRFSLPTIFMPLDSASLLPPFLSALELGSIDFPKGGLSHWISMCPKTITSLNFVVRNVPTGSFAPFCNNNTIKRLTIRSLVTPEEGWDSLLHQLPPNLLLLILEDLSYPSDAKITKKSFKQIPKLVSRVFLPYTPALDSKCCNGFPKLNRIHLFQSRFSVVST